MNVVVCGENNVVCGVVVGNDLFCFVKLIVGLVV